MTTSNQTTAPTASAESPTAPEDWAPILREHIEAAGFTVEGLPENLSRDEALALATGLERQIQSRTPATPEGLAIVEIAAAARDLTLSEVAAATGVDLIALSKADVSTMARYIGTLSA